MDLNKCRQLCGEIGEPVKWYRCVEYSLAYPQNIKHEITQIQQCWPHMFKQSLLSECSEALYLQ